MGTGEITIRPLNRDEWPAFREIRLSALKSEPGVFASSYDAEVSLRPEEWQDTIVGPGHQVFGLFDGDLLIGITAVFTQREDPSGQTALLAMSYICPEYRGRGLAKLFYETRLTWIRERAQFKRIVVSHRLTNLPSRNAIERQGFVYKATRLRTWPDGETVEERMYEMLI